MVDLFTILENSLYFLPDAVETATAGPARVGFFYFVLMYFFVIYFLKHKHLSIGNI
jgi:hypothetical protein